jgi:hypothetical protein
MRGQAPYLLEYRVSRGLGEAGVEAIMIDAMSPAERLIPDPCPGQRRQTELAFSEGWSLIGHSCRMPRMSAAAQLQRRRKLQDYCLRISYHLVNRGKGH